MKISDIIKNVLSSDYETETQKQNHLVRVDVDTVDVSDDKVMVPPLQAKLEIMKKSEGLPNVYDGESDDAELKKIKSYAGLTAVKIENNSDNDLTG